MDFLLGLSDFREKFEDRRYLNSKLEEHYEVIKMYDQLGNTNRKTLRIVLERLNQTELEKNDKGRSIDDKSCDM